MNISTRHDQLCGECQGFLREEPVLINRTRGGWFAAAKRGEEAQPPLEPDEAFEVSVSARAIKKFRDHHGGSATAAEAQIRSLLEDLLRSGECHRERAGGRWILHFGKGGYGLVLYADGMGVFTYFTAHFERTWAQVKAGVPSRLQRRLKTYRENP